MFVQIHGISLIDHDFIAVEGQFIKIRDNLHKPGSTSTKS